MQGPSTLPEILEILKPMVQRLVKMWRQTHPGMTQLRGQSWRKVLVTTSYSGIDFPGTALAMITAYLRELGISLDVQFYSACDVDPQCQKGLMNKKPEMGKPEHVFDTLLGHFPEDLIQTLLSAAKAAREHVGQVVRATESKYGKKAARDDVPVAAAERWIQLASRNRWKHVRGIQQNVPQLQIKGDECCLPF
jgi:hypothetical protein